MEKEKKAQPNVVLTMPKEIKVLARKRSIEIYGDYRSLSQYIRDLVEKDAKDKSSVNLKNGRCRCSF